MATRTTGNSLRTRVGGSSAPGDPPPLPTHPGQQPNPPGHAPTPPPPPGGGDGGGDDGDDGGDDDDDPVGPVDDPDRPAYIPLDRWIDIQGIGLVISNALRANQTPKRSKGAKPRDPDRYDGSDPSKLDDFFFHCEVIFEYYPDAYPDDSSKVLYAIQYLKDTAQRHFRNSFSLPEDEKPDYYRSWDAFVNEMRVNFGELDRSGNAGTQLLALKMQEHHKVSRYKVDFEELAGRVPWDQAVLADLFYKGLAERIKDSIAASPNGKAATLAGRKNQALAIDTRYWERKLELSQGNKSSKSTSQNDTSSSSNARTNTSNASQPGSSQRTQQPSTSSSNRPNNSNTSNNPSSSNSNRNNSSSNSNRNHSSSNSTPKPSSNRPNAPNLEGKVDEHGKLTEAEKQRRKSLGLCMYCEQKGHLVNDCPTRKAKEEAKARRAAATTPDASQAPKN